ncbi:SGNH/GDSL hydrolase family protein [Xinfangfangia sp. CPCC 101601]|uniref:SGNH/GDSL hydrolase family protein n=1 Tax=Pseudogemmobacter lacusdianii TaxID=3069608 RepID=A0ABU0VW62_9RHOB|nr:SGNH/GDSL hydrolase family protein [Xinfangfangia sp. CPCC 101601]MDQ2065994.1 SGNH/GDSL hydrolase family protein [Xinfangfangia sp. CPCC 101601]
MSKIRTVLLFGDSNTHGTKPMHALSDLGRYDRSERWAGLLQGLLPQWHVIEEGHPGRTTLHDDPIEGPHRNGLKVLPALLDSHRPLDLVVIMLGTNDLKERFSVNAGDIALSVGRLVQEIRGSVAGPEGTAPQVLVIAPPPIIETGCLAEIFAGGAAKSHQLAKRMQAMAAREGVAFLDAGNLVEVSPIDGIHYGPEANPVLAEAIAEAITRHFP